MRRDGRQDWKSTSEIQRETGLSYSSILKLARNYPDRIRMVRTQGHLRFHPDSGETLCSLWQDHTGSEGPNMTIQASAYREALKMLSAVESVLVNVLDSLACTAEALLMCPPVVTGYIHGLPSRRYELKRPIRVLVEPSASGFVASFPEAGLQAHGESRTRAVHDLRRKLGATIQSVFSQSPYALSQGERELRDALAPLLVNAGEVD